MIYSDKILLEHYKRMAKEYILRGNIPTLMYYYRKIQEIENK